MHSATKSPSLANVERLREHLGVEHPPEHFYVALLGLATFDAVKLHDRVEEGFSYTALERLRKALDVSTSKFCELIWIAPRTLARRKESGRLQPDESDRLLRLSRTFGLTLQLFEGELSEARSWLLTPHPALGNESPVKLATTEVGSREVEHLIGRLEHGIPL